MREVSETEPVCLGHRMEERAEERRESRIIRGLWLAWVKLKDMILLDEGRKQGEFQENKRLNSFEINFHRVILA